MSFNEEKRKRDTFLLAIYKAAKASRPTCPEAARIGFSKSIRYNMASRQVLDNSEERGGYILGEQLGLSETEVDSFLNYLGDRANGYLELHIGNSLAGITQKGIQYLVRLEEEQVQPIQVRYNSVHIGEVHAPVQIQNDVVQSSQTQEIHYSNEDLKAVFALIQKDIANMSAGIREEFSTEIEYALKQMEKGKPVKQQLQNIGSMLTGVGLGVMEGVIASPIWEVVKRAFGFH